MAIKPKYGRCSKCGREDMLLYRRHPQECRTCYEKGKREQYRQREKEKRENGGIKPKKYTIKPISDKEAKRLAEYRVKRDKYLAEHKTCEVKDCFRPSNNLHHKAGRIGDLLTNEEYFMACCEKCHPSRIHNNPNWAEENGYIVRVR